MDDKQIKVDASASVAGNSIKASVEGDQKAVSEFFSGIVPDFIKDGAGILSDQVKYWRWERQVEIIKSAQQKIKASGLEKKQIPLKVLVPIIQNSSLEDDVAMQDKWSNMLANASTGNVDVSPNYAAILNELSPLEVSILTQIYSQVNKESDYQKRKDMKFDAEKIRGMLFIEEPKMDLIIENLFRLNLFQPPAGDGITVGEFKFTLRTNKVFEFTTLGYEFVKACSWE